MTADISRHSLRPAQLFTGVVRQQGRVPLDADETEGDDLNSLALRLMVADTICANGSPDDGFIISDPMVADGQLDFHIEAGTFYLGGSRLESLGEQYVEQPDWLTFPLDAPGPDVPPGERVDLVWLMAEDQLVTATEDAELIERALGGPDTTARRRMMWRVIVREDVPDDCAEAFVDLVEDLFEGGKLGPDGCEILSDARLTIGFTQLEPLDDLCRPTAEVGFLGARNETFRIQVTEPGRFLWGRDNAAPLYRVQIADDDDGARRRLNFLTLPRDEFGWPLAGMTVELLRWGSLLDNLEKVAEPMGELFRVATGFDPETASLDVTADLPDLTAWFGGPGQAAVNPLDEDGRETYVFLRVWTGGGEGNDFDHDMDVGTAVELGETGLTATFTSEGLPGDFWIVSARPNTPTLVTPWALLDEAPPAGPRRLIAPLALLHWQDADEIDVHDCRHHFRPLCEVGTCCRVTVGDGRLTFGDVTSIQEAVDRLPAEGGEICIHPGEYHEHVVIGGRQNIVITGCGPFTRWLGEDELEDPLLSIFDSSNILIRRLAMESAISESVFADELQLEARAPLRRIVLEDLVVRCADTAGIRILGGAGHVVRRCQVLLEAMTQTLADDPVIGRAAAVVMSGEDLLIERNRIGLDTLLKRRIVVDGFEQSPGRILKAGGVGAFGVVGNRARLAAGGIHIGGGSRQVIIQDNRIQGGNGHGITLGSVQFLPDVEEGGFTGVGDYTTLQRRNMRLVQGYGAGAVEYLALPIGISTDGCIDLPGDPDIPVDDPTFPESGGVVRDIRVLRNDITDMGFSGISAHVFAGLGRDGRTDAVAVELIEICENRIIRCMRNEVGEMNALLRLFVGFGGIALSICSDALVRDNFIAGNGANSSEAICGIFIAIAEAVRITGNRIEQNGVRPRESTVLLSGRRGGIVIGLALGGIATDAELEETVRPADRAALIVSDNQVDAPNGRALKAILLGPCMVVDNRLVGANDSAFFSNVFASLVAAGLSISIVGRQLLAPREEIDPLDYFLLELLSDVLGGDAVNLMSLCIAEDMLLIKDQQDAAAQRLRGGELMVNDNQISLRRHSPRVAATVAALTLLSADDVSCCDNQVEIENEVRAIITNTLAIGATLRVDTNRLQEGLTAGFLSAITFGLMNQTSYNQTTHCIIAIGWAPARVVTGNRSVLGLFNAEICQLFERFGATISERLGGRSAVGTSANSGDKT
ncbi:MAG: DUF6519 domain-containing protein [Allosphingosinicella sp.]